MSIEGGREPLSRFVGRDAELRTLAAALDGARAGRGRLVAVTGESGIGKTRLVEELIGGAGLPPGQVLWGRCLAQAGTPSYWPWTRILHPIIGLAMVEKDGLAALLGLAIGVVSLLVAGTVVLALIKAFLLLLGLG